MALPPEWRRVRRPQLGPAGIEQDVARELRAHLDLKIDELVAAGLTRSEAERAARSAFGDVGLIEAECVDVRQRRAVAQRRRDMFQDVTQDIRYGFRAFRRSPGFTAVAVLTLALGANAAIFSAVEAVMLRPLPFDDPSRLVAISPEPNASISKRTLAMLRERQRAFTAIAGYSRWGFTFTGRGEPELLAGATGTANLFATLGARAMLGRTFSADEDRPGHGAVVILSYGLWVRRFGADSSIVGRAITLNGEPQTIIGVMPREFEFPSHGTAVWTPAVIDAANANDYAAGYLLGVGRLRPGATVASATADLREAVAGIRATLPAQYDSTYGRLATVAPLRDAIVGRTRSTLILLFAAVGLVLLIGCANVMNLLLARGASREHELALRAALGAGRGRLVRQFLTESLLLAALGAGVGLLLAVWGTRLIGAGLPGDLVRVGEIAVDTRVLAFTALIATVVGILFGVVPALRAGRQQRLDGLRDGGRAGSGLARRRTMRALIVGEIALALMLAAGTGLVVRSFWRLRAESPGFRAEGVLALGVAAPGSIYESKAKQVALYDALIERLRAIPGVVSVGAVHLLPFGGSNWNPELVIEGRASSPGAPSPEVDWRVATPDYFRTMGIALRRGRMFTSADDSVSPAVAIINESLARRDFADTDPIGKRVRTFFEGKGGWASIIGVVADSKDQTLAGAARPQMYRPFAQYPLTGMAVMVRTTGDPMTVAPSARRALASIDADIPLERVRPLEDVVSDSIAQPRLLVMLLGTFGALALVLGAIGIYGVMAYAVVQRMREMGVRSALGAAPRDLFALVIGEALGLAAIGIALGAAAAFGLTGLLRSQLYAVSATDPATFAVAALGLVVVAIVASGLPALRATRVDPASVLRS